MNNMIQCTKQMECTNTQQKRTGNYHRRRSSESKRNEDDDKAQRHQSNQHRIAQPQAVEPDLHNEQRSVQERQKYWRQHERGSHLAPGEPCTRETHLSRTNKAERKAGDGG